MEVTVRSSMLQSVNSQQRPTMHLSPALTCSASGAHVSTGPTSAACAHAQRDSLLCCSKAHARVFAHKGHSGAKAGQAPPEASCKPPAAEGPAGQASALCHWKTSLSTAGPLLPAAQRLCNEVLKRQACPSSLPVSPKESATGQLSAAPPFWPTAAAQTMKRMATSVCCTSDLSGPLRCRPQKRWHRPSARR